MVTTIKNLELPPLSENHSTLLVIHQLYANHHITYVFFKGIDQEGIYRVSGIKSKIDELKSQYNHGKYFQMKGL